MNGKLILVSILGIFMTLAVRECSPKFPDLDGSDPNNAASGHQAVKELPGLRLILQTDKAAYAPGEPIPLRFEVINTGSAPVIFDFPSSQQFDFLAKSGDTVVWQWAFGKLFLQVFITAVLDAGKSLVFQASWEQLDNAGQPVAPGTYQILAMLTVQNQPLESAPLTIQIQAP